MNNLEQKAKEYSPESFLLQIVFKDGFRACEKEYEEKLRGISVEETQKPVQGTDLMINTQKFSYTEEEVKNMLGLFGKHIMSHPDLDFGEEFEEAIVWFEHNKKK